MPARPPTITETEREAIGACLRSQEAAEELSSELEASDFSNDVCRKVFNAIKGLSDEDLEVTRVSVAERASISTAEVEELASHGSGITQSQLRTLLSEIKRISGLRAIYFACSQTRESINKEAKLEEILDYLEKGLYRLDRQGAQEAVDGSDALQAALKSFRTRFQGGGGPEVSTGLKALDKAIIGLRPGKMMVIAARPSMGKTALADSIRRAVLDQGYGAIQFSLEMSEEELAEREIAYRSGVNLRKILAAKELTDEELGRINGVGEWLSNVQSRWFIDDRTTSISGIRRRTRILSGRMARQGIKTGVVILDYIQLAGENGEGREQSVAAISRGCKLMAKELGCTVLALSQLNRACEAREDRRPMMSDLRESGSIEQDADIVAFVYREHMYDSSIPPSEAELIIRKHRSGPTGTVHLKYNEKTVSFSDLDTMSPELTQ